MKRRLALLGSTGSIGQSSLDVVRAHADRLSVVSLAAGRQWELLVEQTREFCPRLVAVFEPEAAARFREAMRGVDVAVREGMPGLLEAACLAEADTLVSALVGSIGLRPVMAAIDSGKSICLANKETLVVGGALVTAAARRKHVPLIPIDSEHSAIFQCLADGHKDGSQIKRLVLTASGGPFRMMDSERLARVTPGEALRHPNWNMGGKITIDSATLMNKGLEVIEAHWLFGIDFERIEVVVHPQSIIHSLVEFIDGSFLGQLGAPDMRLPIQYALSYPERWQASGERLDLLKLGTLSFEPPRMSDFPCLAYAYEAGRRGGSLPCTMNAANEVAVAAFLRGDIGFTDIPAVIRNVMDALPFEAAPDLDALLRHDELARGEAAVQVAAHSSARQGAEAVA